ncbi:MarR family winged helix-turn-helix transcriptional regulator [Cohnella sp. GCM10027633]|uniref:MarR family winged helix-turn-helix transcriptional regulator n=1 Tax=unclassified Cohnella TaxID=2636738 RepID=UPI003638CB26
MDDSQRFLQILQSHRELNKTFYQLLQSAANLHGITPVQFIVLAHLARNPNIRLSDLAERMNLGNSTMSGIIDRMVKAELVSRERTEADRRAMTLNLTEKGLTLRQETEATKIKFLQPLLQLSERDQLEWHRIQQDIIRILDQVREEVPHHNG